MALPTLLSQIGNALSSAEELSDLISLDFSSDSLAGLQNDMLAKSYDVQSLVESRKYFSGDWNAFGQFIVSYVTFVRDVNPYDLEGSYPLLEKLFNDFQVAFSNRRGGQLAPIARKLASLVTSLAISLDSVTPSDNEFMPRSTELAKVLLKMFNSIRAERLSNESGEFSKKDVILFVAVLLCKLYFKLDQPAACANVFSNIHTANIQFSKYPRSERVTYRYYLGRFYLLRQELLHARAHLSWAFLNCSSSAMANQRAILTYLIPANLLTGIYTRPEIYSLAGSTLREAYFPLQIALKAGDLYSFNEHLVRHFDWFIRKKMFLLLRSSAQIVIFRNLFRKIDRMVTLSASPAQQSSKRPNDLSFDQLLAGVRVSVRANSDAISAKSGLPSANAPAIFPFSSPEMAWSFEDIENICISLIDQGYMKANIYARSKILRLMPSGGFPTVAEVLASRTRSSADHEQWMER